MLAPRQPPTQPTPPPARRRVLMGLLFFPRGGSAHVVRSLAHALPAQGWEATVVSGSLQLPGQPGDARAFFQGLRLEAVDYTAALRAADPLRADPPLHPSYEDRPGAPDRVFAAVDDDTYAHLVIAWSQILQQAGAAAFDLLHLHHLTPLNEAARLVAPDVPVVGHLHGTELLLLEAIGRQPPTSWRCAQAWAERMRRWAAQCQRIVVSSAPQVARAQAVLAIDPARCVIVPNGFDPATFHHRPIDRLALWRRLLVEQPRGWSPGRQPGSVAYTPDQVGALARSPVLLYVGRFTAVKRLALLIEAYQRAQANLIAPAPLVLVGGFPGEWEDEHPFDTIRRTGAQNVFLAGWHEHEELPEILAAADVIVLPSVREQFGQVLVEGMACGLPAIAVNAHGPREIVADGQTGWLVPPDDEQALAAALVSAVNDPAERHRRGAAASAAARARYGWPSLGRRLADAYETLLAESRPS